MVNSMRFYSEETKRSRPRVMEVLCLFFSQLCAGRAREASHVRSLSLKLSLPGKGIGVFSVLLPIVQARRR